MIAISNVTERERKLIERLIPKCEKELNACKINYGQVKEIAVNRRAKKRWGQCRKNKDGTFSININENLITQKTIRSLHQTLLHEYCYTVPDGNGHKKGWMEAATKLNRRYNFNISRTNSSKELGVHVEITPKNSKYILEFICTVAARESSNSLITKRR